MFSLPSGPIEHNDLDQLKRQAKDLLRAFEEKDTIASELVSRHFPEATPGTLQLTGAQLVIARHHGFASWAQLRAEVDRVNMGKLLHAVEHGNVRQARELLKKRPELASMNVAENDEHRALHFAVLRRDEPMVRTLMQAGADAHLGIYPHRDATTAYLFAQERGFADITDAIDEEERFRRENLSCPNATVSPVQDEIAALIRTGDHAAAIALLAANPDLARTCDREGATLLHVACQEGALPIIDWLLAHSANPRKEDLGGKTPLERAVNRVGWKTPNLRHEFPAIAQRLIRLGAPISSMVAVALGDLGRIRHLFERDPASFQAEYWSEPNLLSKAAAFGNIEVVRLLLDLGLDPDERVRLRYVEKDVFSQGHPLWLAAALGEYEIARLLMERGADPNGMVYASGTPMERAYGARDEKMKELLISFGGKASPGIIGGNRAVAEAEQFLSSLRSEQEIRQLLWSAACAGSPEIVRLTLPLLAWPRDHGGWHAIMIQPLRIHLHSPVGEHPECFDRSTYPECLRLILDHGVDINLTSAHGVTLMHAIAAEGKCWGIVVMKEPERLAFARIALAHSPSLTLRDKLLKSTPLAWACRWGRTELVNLLLEHGAPANEPDAEPWATPLAWASKKGHAEIVELLRQKGADA
jgi:ankyrin repeat protein